MVTAVAACRASLSRSSQLRQMIMPHVQPLSRLYQKGGGWGNNVILVVGWKNLLEYSISKLVAKPDITFVIIHQVNSR